MPFNLRIFYQQAWRNCQYPDHSRQNAVFDQGLDWLPFIQQFKVHLQVLKFKDKNSKELDFQIFRVNEICFNP